MTAHLHTTLTPGCYRCDLNLDEIAAAEQETRSDAQEAWLTYRDAHMRSRGLSGPRATSHLRRREFVAGYLAAMSE